jgi:hypothetical protein
MGNGRAKKPPFPGIDSRSNAHGDGRKRGYSDAVPTRAREYPRNRFQRRENFTIEKKKKMVAHARGAKVSPPSRTELSL